MKITTIHGDTIDLVPGMKLDGAMLRDLILDGVNLRGSSLVGCYFNESSLIGADLSDCDLTGAVFYRADLSGADLTGSTVAECYWVDMRHSATTKWPASTTAPVSARAGVDKAVSDFMSGWKGGLCTPGAVDPDKFEGIITPLQHFAAGLEPGPVSPDTAERLYTRLALNLYRIAALTAGEFGMAIEPDVGWDGWSDSFQDFELAEGAYAFTACALLLCALGIRFERVIDEDTVSVTFRPHTDMNAFAEHDAISLFRLMLALEIGAEIDEDSTLSEAMAAPSEFHPYFDYACDESSHADVSRMLHTEDAIVRIVDGPRRDASVEETVLGTIFEFTYFVAQSAFVVDNDDESDVDSSDDADADDDDLYDDLDDDDVEPEDDDDDTGASLSAGSGQEFDCNLDALLFRALGIVSSAWIDEGIARAEIRPPMDIETLVAESPLSAGEDGFNESGWETKKRTLQSLGLAGAQPSLGAFSWLAR